MQDKEPVRVVAGVVESGRGSILIARRPEHLHQGGKWEFPGGKIESAESAYDALVRELDEELGIHVTKAIPLIQVPYQYPDKYVLLDVWRVQRFEGSAKGREGQRVRWITPDQFSDYEFPPANHAIIAALRYPEVYAISDIQRYGKTGFMVKLERALKRGLRFLQLREHQLSKQEFLAVAEEVVAMCHHFSGKVLLNCDPDWVQHSRADGVHLTEQRLLDLSARPLGENYLVAASCHNEATLRHAETTGANFVVLSPVKPTKSHPNIPYLGWDRFQAMCVTTSLPVYALGGLRLEDLVQARQHGAQGVSMIRGLWESSFSD
jgi:8-oxo-dGTP diphosphatase